ncbi:peptidase inhibitor family I36 protein [Streptomyces sp. SP17BM10]|uniref:peptidase inhibitor family I36 protein n=1 Tax=Streptomyces sp. SP17BM10 TaxID=3002530 RepID=UPI002E76D516|nr:peptidase inhibitor family I36 protein [Streptomyces sp. SP17BM10]MEE1782809.1 peptidase inhibitor family I36 protein [Streptomyces sp. SP17BM10]
MNKKMAATALAAVTLGTVLLGTATPALASSGGCVSGDACVYYSPNLQGAFFGKGEAGNYDGYFGGGGAGNGQAVMNNAASVWNMDPTWNVRVYYREYSIRNTGPNQYIPHNSWANLGAVPWNGGSINMRNNNHSQGWEL